MGFFITTTGTQGGGQPTFPVSGYVPFTDIGKVPGYAHPTVSYDLEQEYTREDIASSTDIFDAITYGWITVVDDYGNPITDPDDIAPGGNHELDVHSNVDTTGKVSEEGNSSISGYEVGSSLAWDGTDWVEKKTSYRHKQNSAASTWNVTHSLGRNPSGITILDSGGTVVEGCVTIVDLNNLTIEFTAAFGGVAFIS